MKNKKTIELSSIELKESKPRSLCAHGESFNYIQRYAGELHIFKDDCFEETIQVGEIQATHINVHGAILFGGLPLIDFFDCEADLYEMTYPLLNFEEGRFKDEIIIEYNLSRILIIDLVTVDPEYRGFGMGLAAIKLLTGSLCADGDVILLKAKPLQFDDKFPKEKAVGLSRNKNKSEQALHNHYASIGFRKLGNSRVMISSLEDMREVENG